jgi:Amt family ammonium transporter
MVINSGDTSWILVSTGLVMIMIPALCFFEASLIRSKNSDSSILGTFG